MKMSYIVNTDQAFKVLERHLQKVEGIVLNERIRKVMSFISLYEWGIQSTCLP